MQPVTPTALPTSSHHLYTEDSNLLENYAVVTGKQLPTFRQIVVASSSASSSPRRWQDYIRTKCRQVFSGQHGAVSQKTWTFSTSYVKAANLLHLYRLRFWYRHQMQSLNDPDPTKNKIPWNILTSEYTYVIYCFKQARKIEKHLDISVSHHGSTVETHPSPSDTRHPATN